jgi:hypothetical protein
MFVVTNTATGVAIPAPNTPLSQAPLEPALQGKITPFEFVPVAPLTAQSLSITTDGPSFIHSGWGNDIIIDNSMIPGDVVIDPGRGTNTIQASSNPTSRDTIIVDVEPDPESTPQEQSVPLIDTINGLKAGDSVLIKGLTLPPAAFMALVSSAPGTPLTLTIPTPPSTGPAQIVLSGYTSSDLGGRLIIDAPFVSTNPDVSSYDLIRVLG